MHAPDYATTFQKSSEQITRCDRIHRDIVRRDVTYSSYDEFVR